MNPKQEAYAAIIERLDALYSLGYERSLTLLERAEIDDLMTAAWTLFSQIAVSERWCAQRAPLAVS